MSHSVKRRGSKFEQFRMAVPAELRAIIGRREWTKSLRTTDAEEARRKRAEWVGRCSAEIQAARLALANRGQIDAAALLDTAFDRLAATRGSMDRAIALQLEMLANLVVNSWAARPTEDDEQWWGEFLVRRPASIEEPVDAFETDRERSLYQLRADLVEGRGIADGLVHQEIAADLLAKRIFQPIWPVVSYMQSIEPRLPLVPQSTYDHVAEAFLRRLAEHQFESWPAHVREALASIVHTNSIEPSSAQAPPAPSPVSHKGLLTKRLSEALQYWIDQRRPRPSPIAEASRAVARYIALFGDVAIGDITRDHVVEFRNYIADLAPQTELAKLERLGRSLRSSIEEARERRLRWDAGDRSEPQLARVAPGTVKKDVGAISQILGAIQSDIGGGVNVAANIRIAGYTKTRQGQQRPHLPFTPDMMQRLFDSPLFTGCAGPSDMDRTRPGPNIYQDELYWSLLFGVVGGPRLGEIGQIALTDVHDCDLARTFGGDLQGHCTFLHITGTGDGQNTKNDTSERYVVIHNKLIELGFLDYVARRRATGATRLFDLKATKGASLTKGLSQRLNRYLDRVVTADPRYVFHSTRHEFTDRADMSMMPTRVANSIKGHANLTEGEKYGLVSIRLQYVHLKNLNLSFINWDRLGCAAQRSQTDSNIATIDLV